MDKTDIQLIINKHPNLVDKLFARGFLFTDANLDLNAYPFFGQWNKESIRGFNLFVSMKQNYYIQEVDGMSIILIGHAYNPFTGKHDENEILYDLIHQYTTTTITDYQNVFWKSINELTGIFTIILIDKDDIYVIGDASAMQTTFYLTEGSENKVFISSHTNLIGDLLSLSIDSYVDELIHYCFFKLLGNSLPGNLTQFKEVKRLIPNHYLKISKDHRELFRFYWPIKQNKTEEQIVDEVADLLHCNMELISRKWKQPAISLTGGCDSKTTLACTNGLYDHFSYFSYISSESEKVDAVAAEKICNELGLNHKTYHISENDSDFADVDAVREILNWNTGNIRYSHPNDIRKRIFFADTADFDVEVKSWASEIGRAYYSKRFHERKDFGECPTPRKCTTLYKFFLHNRSLVKKTDKVFEDYLKNFFQQEKKNPVEWQEQFFWEFRVPSWNGLVITGEHRYSFDITIPYNNRLLLELLLSASIETRIKDEIYSAIRRKMNPIIDNTGIAVTNLKHTKRREQFENFYYWFNTHLPF